MVYKTLQNQGFQNCLLFEREICVFAQDAHNLYLHVRYMQVLPDTVEPFLADNDKQATYLFLSVWNALSNTVFIILLE